MPGPIFIADPPDARTIVSLESLIAIFHVRSGMTHLLAPPAPEILDVLGEGPADAATVLTRLLARYEMDATGALDVIEARLDELEASGLVWCR